MSGRVGVVAEPSEPVQQVHGYEAGHRAIADLLHCERRVRGIRDSRMRHVDGDRLPHKKVVTRQRRWHPQRKFRTLRRVQMVAPRQFVNHLPTE